MRSATLCVLKRSRLHPATYRIARKATDVRAESSESGSGLVSVRSSWAPDEEADLRARVLRDTRVLPNFVSEEEEAALMAELEPYLRKLRYEYDHWDDAIHGYRETERGAWNERNAAVLARVQAVAFAAPGSGQPLPHAHVLDLAAEGHIKPHIDATRFCGEVIAGVCLLSDAVMRLAHPSRPAFALDARLPRRCLYVLRGAARHDMTHAVLGGEESGRRGRRVSLICRSRPTKLEEDCSPS